MTRTSNELGLVVGFLNKAPAAKGGSVLRDCYDTAVATTYNRLRFALTNLLAPELNVRRKWISDDGVQRYEKPAERKTRAAFINRYGPKVGLIELVKHLNEHAEKPRWRAVTTTKNLARINLPGFTGSIVKQEFSEPVWQAIALLLESGNILRIGQCPGCRKFFEKSRDWQKSCPKVACRQTYENQVAADRQARLRRQRRANTKR